MIVLAYGIRNLMLRPLTESIGARWLDGISTRLKTMSHILLTFALVLRS